MKEFVIISDSSCNLTSEEMKKYGIAKALPMRIYVDGKEYGASGDWPDFSAKEYYDKIRNGATLSSSQVPERDYEEAFEEYLEKGYDILSISCTAALSNSVNESIAVSEKLKAKYPDSKIICIDSHNCTYGAVRNVAAGEKTMEMFRVATEEFANVEKAPLLEGRFLTMILGPKADK